MILILTHPLRLLVPICSVFLRLEQFKLKILDELRVLAVNNDKGLLNWTLAVSQYVLLRDLLVLDDSVQMLNLLEVVIKFALQTHVAVFIHLNPFVVA